MLQFLINVELFDEVRMQAMCKTLATKLQVGVWVRKSSLIAAIQEDNWTS